jgi:DNA-binding transcriptional MocR family regulator
VILDPGDVALMELPSYTGAIVAFRNVGASMVGIRQQSEGIDLEELERTVVTLRGEGRRVKLLYVIPNFQNPSGRLLGRSRRLELLEWAMRRDVLILEDDPYRDLHFSDCGSEDDLRPVAADDRDERAVVYLSSFSKTLAPGFRVGWLSAPKALAEKIELAKQAVDLCTGGLDQLIVFEACRRGVLAQQGPRLRRLYEERRDAMVAALHREAAERLSWATPQGGFFLWARLTSGADSVALLAFARARGVTYVPGTAFHVDGGGQEYMRLSFSEPPPDRIDLGVKRLADAIADAT